MADAKKKKSWEQDKLKLRQKQFRIKNDPRLDAMEKSEENAKVAFSFFRKHIFTKKLSYLEDLVKSNESYEFKGIVAMYIYFHKSDKVSKALYPTLHKIMVSFEQAVEDAKENDPYFEVFKIYELKRNKEKASSFMGEAKKHINNILEEENISINQLSEFTGIKYANLFNFLKKENKKTLKLKSVHKALWLIRGLKEGLTIEESMEVHKKKMRSLWKDWTIDIDDI